MTQDNEKVVWFKGCDVASILGYSNTRDAFNKYVDEDEKKKMNEFQMVQNKTPINSQPHSIFMNESGLFPLILRSKLEEAKKLKKWVTKEVLPSIRKYG